jgi:hypothetical protein
MKTPTSLALATLAWLFVSIPAHAQKDTAAATKAKKPASPFVKNAPTEKASSADPLAGANQPASYSNVGLLIQHIDVKRELWQAWLDENAAPLDAGPLRKLVETWIANGDAHLAESSLVMGRSGQRAKVESQRRMVYPVEFDLGNGEAAPFPVAWEIRNPGTTVEVDPVLESDRSVSYNTAPTRITYRGESLPRPAPTGTQPGDVRWPDFFNQTVTVQTNQDADQWAILGSETPVDGRDSHLTLIFSRPLAHRFETGEAKQEDDSSGLLKFEWIEIDHATLNRWIMETKDLSQLVGGNLRKLANDEGGKTINSRIIRFQAGTRVKNESVNELRRATEFDQGVEGALSTPAGIETWNTGITVEVDPIYTAEGQAVEVNMAPEWITHFGETVHHRLLRNGEWVPDVTTPNFYTMKTTTQVTAPLNVPLLVSVMSPPDDKG